MLPGGGAEGPYTGMPVSRKKQEGTQGPLRMICIACRHRVSHAAYWSFGPVPFHILCSTLHCTAPGRSLTRRKKRSVPVPWFPKSADGHTMCWRLAVGGWRLAVGGSWQLVAVDGGWRQLVVGDWRLMAVNSGWRLAVDGPLGRSLRAVLNKKKKSRSQRTALHCTALPFGDLPQV